MNKSLAEIAQLVGGTLEGEEGVRITGLNGLSEAAPGDLSFLVSPKYDALLATTNATAVIVPADYSGNGIPMIRVEHPYLAFATVLKEVEQQNHNHPSGTHPSAVIDPTTTLGENVGIGTFVHVGSGCSIGDNVVLYPGVYIGSDVTIGPDTVIYPNTTVRDRVQIGARCIIHNNSSIGSDGFGFARTDDGYVKIPHVGTVIIHDDVEIGSNTSIDRATAGETIIGKGTKIDNQCQIAHNVVIGEHCAIASFGGISGSTTVGNNVDMGGRVGAAGHITIGDNVQIGGGSGVLQSVSADTTVIGYPALEAKLSRRVWAVFPQLPKLLRRLRSLEKRVDEMES